MGAAGLALIGCGDDDDEPEATATQPGNGQTPAASTTAAASKPVEGGTLHTTLSGTLGSAPATWDPYVNSSGPGQALWGFMTNRVIRFTTEQASSGPGDFRLEPDVASSIPEQPDASTIVIKLRNDVKWQNIAPVNGRQMTADDVAFSIDRYKRIGQQKNQLAAIERIDVTDPTTVTIHLNKPTVSVVAVLADPKAVWLMAKEVAQDEIGPTGPFIGTGPFLFDGYDTDVQLKFKKNPNYFEAGLPHIDAITAAIIEQRVTMEANFRSKQLDNITVDGRPSYEELRKLDGVSDISNGGTGYPRQEMALHVPPFNNRAVRQAMSMAVDRNEVADALDVIDYKWATHPFPAEWGPYVLDPQNPSTFGENAKYFQYNPKDAKAMLSAAGYPDGFETVIHFTPYYSGHQLTMELLVEQFFKIGVKLTLDSYSYTEYQQKYKSSKPIEERLWEGMFANQPASYSDPSLSFLTYWLPTSGRNVQLYKDDALVQMFTKQDQELDQEKRYDIIQDMQRHMAFEMNGIPMVTTYESQLWHQRLQNYFYKNDNGRGVTTYARMWIDEKA